MSMEFRSPSVNLLKTKGHSFGDKFISWALTVGRMIIILTETIALVAFLYRFILDRQLVDQRDRISQKAAQVKLYEASENNFRNLQERLALITKFKSQAPQVYSLISDIIQQTPSGMTFNSVTYSSARFTMNANVQSIGSLTTFVNKLKENSDITSISIDKIENKTLNSTIVVGITASLHNKYAIVEPK